MPEFIPLIFIGFVILIIVLAVVGAIQKRKRRQALAGWAMNNGWQYDPGSDHSFDQRYPSFDCLKQGSDRYAHNIVSGQRKGREFQAFDYHYETHSTDSKGRRQTHHHHFSAVIIRPQVLLKPLVIRPENLFDKLAGFFGFDDIDFESAEFSRAFCVKSPDRRWAYDVLHSRTIELLLASPRFSIAFDNLHAIAWTGRTFDIADFEQAADVLEGVLDQLPDYVRQQQGAIV